MNNREREESLTLEILEAIDAQSDVTQRHLAHRTGIAGAAFHPLNDALVTTAPMERRMGVWNARAPTKKITDHTGQCGRPQFTLEGDLMLAGKHLYTTSDWKMIATASVNLPAALAADGSGVAGVLLTDKKVVRYLPVRKP